MAERNFFGGDTPQSRAAQNNQIWEQRQRTRQDVVESYETIDDPRDVPVDQQGEGFAPAPEFLEWAQPQEAAHDIDQEIGHYDVERDDVAPVDGGGFGLTQGAQRRVAASGFEQDTLLEDVDPEDDVQPIDDGGFGLTQGAQRRVAAEEFERDTPLESVDPQDDVRQTDEGFGLTDPALERAYDRNPDFF